MEIFEVSGNVVRPTANILTVSPFKEIWKRDKSKTKSLAMQEFAFIEFMVSKKKSNPFKGYDEEIKEDKIKEKVIVEKKWQPDNLVNDGIDVYKKWQFEASPTIRYYEANLSALNKTIEYLTDGLDYEERNRSGMPVHKFNDVVRGIKEADQVLKSLTSLRKKVEEELYEASRTVNNKEINPYER